MNVELMKQAIAVAVVQLFEGYPVDVLKKFTLEELEEFCEITEPLRPKQVEDIYRNAWDYLRAAPEAEPAFWLNKDGKLCATKRWAEVNGEEGSATPLYLHPSAPERKPMMPAERKLAFLELTDETSYKDFTDGIDAAEAFHGITKG